MSEVTIQYRVPVYVLVDTEARCVRKVVVDDERVELDDDEAEARTVEIAEEAGWPAWEFGW